VSNKLPHRRFEGFPKAQTRLLLLLLSLQGCEPELFKVMVLKDKWQTSGLAPLWMLPVL